LSTASAFLPHSGDLTGNRVSSLRGLNPCLGTKVLSTITIRIALYLTVCVLCWFLFFHRLADRDLWSSHEARAGMDAQTLLDDGYWGLPRLFSGEPELQKPPLYYWLVASIAALRGGTVDGWAVRL